jgi:hypothetical protein
MVVRPHLDVDSRLEFDERLCLVHGALLNFFAEPVAGVVPRLLV